MAIIQVTNETPGAPQLATKAADDITKILRFALPLLGWTIEWDETTRIVFSTEFGSIKHWIRVADDTVDGALINAYTSMTDIDTGTNPTTNQWLRVNYNQTDSFPWTIIGDEKSFIISSISNKSYPTMEAPQYVGGLGGTIFPIDGGAFVISAFTSSSANGSGNFTYTSTYGGVYGGRVVANVDRTDYNVGFNICRTNNVCGYNSTRNATGPYERYGVSFCGPALVIDNNGDSRGYLRGIMHAFGDWGSVHSFGDLITVPTPVGGPKSMTLSYFNSALYASSIVGHFLFDKSNDWDWL